MRDNVFSRRPAGLTTGLTDRRRRSTPGSWESRGLISLVAGGVGEGYVPAALVGRRDAGVTATNILTSEGYVDWG